jgi:hypothetical protein
MATSVIVDRRSYAHDWKPLLSDGKSARLRSITANYNQASHLVLS